MRKLNRREKLILVFTVILLLVYTVFQFMIKPMREGGNDITDRIQMAQHRLSKQQEIIHRQKAIEKEYKGLVDFLGAASSEGAEATAIVAKLEAAARESKVHIANMQPQRAVTKDILRVFPVELIVEGDWPSVVKFIYTVQNKSNLFNIDELNLEKYSDASSSLRGRLLLSRTKVVVN
jgi:Tfp pilus assembly protein PilO